MVGKKYDILIQKNININLYTIKTNLYTRLYTIKILAFLISSSLFVKFRLLSPQFVYQSLLFFNNLTVYSLQIALKSNWFNELQNKHANENLLFSLSERIHEPDSLQYDKKILKFFKSFLQKQILV